MSIDSKDVLYKDAPIDSVVKVVIGEKTYIGAVRSSGVFVYSVNGVPQTPTTSRFLYLDEDRVVTILGTASFSLKKFKDLLLYQKFRYNGQVHIKRTRDTSCLYDDHAHPNSIGAVALHLIKDLTIVATGDNIDEIPF